MLPRCYRSFVLLRRPLSSNGTVSIYLSTTAANTPTSTRRSSRFPDNEKKRRRGTGVPAERGGFTIDQIVEPKPVIPSKISVSAGVSDWTPDLDNAQMGLVLDEFFRRRLVREMATENGLNDKLFMSSYVSFRKYCLNSLNQDSVGDPALLVIFQDIIKNGHDADSLFPYFLQHARKVYPHLEAMDDLRMISDLTQPYNWYPEARSIHRKIIFHAGPTNSGKTYHALKRFRDSKTGVYCGPLKLLASEVFSKMNNDGLNCDLVTGEERRFAIDNHHPSSHLSSTVEMLSTQMRVEVAVIDEIQMLRDEQRGWAWTRALLGVAADEVHLCGEVAAIDIVKKLVEPMGEHVEVRYYERKTPLTIADTAIGTLDNIQPGDCIVCFSRKFIFSISQKLERLGIKPAVIYGDLPPGTKIAQAAKFNDPNDPCNVLVSTDAIGMGLNLNIKRVIFATCTRQNELIPTYSALQIAGRAGRFGTSYADGIATTLRHEDVGTLKDILALPVEPITSVGISPTFEQLETFSFHLPQTSFVRLLDLFISVCSTLDHFFICTVNEMRESAELIDKISLPLKVRYTFCIAPLNVDDKMTAMAFVKMARRFSSGQCLTFDWLMDFLPWPPEKPTKLEELIGLERMYEVLDAYLWLSLRFPDMLPDEQAVREASKLLDGVIKQSVENIVELLENSRGTDAKTGGLAKKIRELNQTNMDKQALEAVDKDIKFPDKRRGRKKSVLLTVMTKAGLSVEELEELKKELRAEEKDDENMKE